MSHGGSLPTPPSEPAMSNYSRPDPNQAAADAIPLLVDDTYHIFHLTTPPNTIHHPPRLRSSWFRMKSKDLVNWTRDVKPVIEPGNQDAEPDASGAWTGSAVIGPDGRMNIFYTGYSLPQNGKQVILRAVSSDREGTTFLPERQEIAVVGSGGLSKFEDIDFRDAYIFFNEEASQYWMLVATRLKEGPHWSRGCIALLTSSDLVQWVVEPEPLYAPNDMFCPECPELFSLGHGKWYLVYSRFAAPNSGTVYRVADSPRGPFRVPRDGSQGRFDGRRWYAAKSCPKAGDPRRRVFFGWLADKCEEDGKWLWGGSLGVPREVYADVDGYLHVEPAVQVEAAFKEISALLAQTSVTISAPGATGITYPEVPLNGNQDLWISLKPVQHDAASFGVVLDIDDDCRAHWLKFIRAGSSWTAVLIIDQIPLDDFWADQYDLHLPRYVDGPEIVRHDCIEVLGGIKLLLRGRLVECFVGGRSISYRLPRSPSEGARRFGLYVEDGTIELDLEVRAGAII